MIQQVTIKNFKCLRDVTVALERVTVFVGANGSGKTSFLQALDLLCRTFRMQPGQLDAEFQQNRSFGATDPVEMSCQSGEWHFRYRSILQAPQQPHRQGWAGDGAAVAKNGSSLDWKQWQPQNGGLPNPE